MDEAHDGPRTWHLIATVLLPFAAGYYLSYLYRTINALLSGTLVSEFGLSAADLGILTAVLFLTFGVIQLPLDAWFDRFGPRRVQAVLLTVAAIGAAIFAHAHTLIGLIVGRALIGFGVAGALMAGLKGSCYGGRPSGSRWPTAGSSPWGRSAPSRQPRRPKY